MKVDMEAVEKGFEGSRELIKADDCWKALNAIGTIM
jgi:hypothetical protein